MKIILEMRKFQGNLKHLGWNVQTLVNVNKKRIFDDLVQRFRVPATKSENFDVIEAVVNTEAVCTAIVPISPANTLPPPNIQISLIDYICKSLTNSDKKFVFRHQQKNEPLISIDHSINDGKSRDPWLIRKKIHSQFDETLNQRFNTSMELTKQITVMLLEELFDDCGLPEIYFTTLVKFLGPTLTSLRMLSSLDSKNRFRVAPEGMISVSPTNLYGSMVLRFGLDHATAVLKVFLSLGKSLKKYSFYKLVLLNIYLAVSMCFIDFQMEPEKQITGSNLRKINFRLSERKDRLMIGVQTMVEKLGVRVEFEEICTALRTYSDVFGVKMSMLDKV